MARKKKPDLPAATPAYKLAAVVEYGVARGLDATAVRSALLSLSTNDFGYLGPAAVEDWESVETDEERILAELSAHLPADEEGFFVVLLRE